MNIKVALCDDMEFYIERTKRNILEYQSDENSYEIYEFLSGKALLNYMENNHLDVIFLDIDMPEMDGIEVATRIREKDNKVIIIFLTNYDDYAKEGYLVQAYRYLSKSSEKELIEAMKSLEKVFRNRKKIVVQDISGNNHAVSLEEIIYGETAGRNVRIYTEKEEIVTSLTLQKFEEILNENCFFRPHMAFVVNMGHILKFSPKEIYMDNQKKVFLSRARYNEFKKEYMNWIFEK